MILAIIIYIAILILCLCMGLLGGRRYKLLSGVIICGRCRKKYKQTTYRSAVPRNIIGTVGEMRRWGIVFYDMYFGTYKDDKLNDITLTPEKVSYVRCDDCGRY